MRQNQKSNPPILQSPNPPILQWYNQPAMNKRHLATLIFALGVLSGLVLAGSLHWAHLEAEFYGFPRYTNQTFPGLTCPPLLTRGETSQIALTLTNPSDRPLNQLVAVQISTPLLAEQHQTLLTLAPHQQQTLTWPIGPQNIDLGNFIFVRAYRYPTSQGPMAEAGCGIFIFSLPLPSRLLLPLWVTLTGLLLLAGLALTPPEPPQRRAPLTLARRLLALSVLLALWLGLRGAWLLGIVLLVFILLLGLLTIVLAV